MEKRRETDAVAERASARETEITRPATIKRAWQRPYYDNVRAPTHEGPTRSGQISNRDNLRVQQLFLFLVFSRVCTSSDWYLCIFLEYFQTCKNIIECNNFVYIILQLSLALLALEITFNISIQDTICIYPKKKSARARARVCVCV